MAEALSETAPLVRELEFSYNELTADGAAAVAACAARKALSLEYLGLEGNEIGSAGAKSVNSCLESRLVLCRVARWEGGVGVGFFCS